MNTFSAFSYARLPFDFHLPTHPPELFKTQTPWDPLIPRPLQCFLQSTEWCTSSPACLHLSHLPLLSGSLPTSSSPFQVLWKCLELPSKPYFPIFCHICICSSFCLECLLHFLTLSSSHLPTPTPALLHQYTWQSHIFERLTLYGISSVKFSLKGLLAMQQLATFFTSVKFLTHCVEVIYLSLLSFLFPESNTNPHTYSMTNNCVLNEYMTNE